MGWVHEPKKPPVGLESWKNTGKAGMNQNGEMGFTKGWP